VGIAENILRVRGRIAAACAAAGREAADVKLVAVSKTHPADAIREAMAAGLSIFGENKVQEGETKIPDVGRNAAEWHLIGHLQSNKARKAVQLFDVIHTVDSVDLAKRLERICIEEGRDSLSVLIQVNVADDGRVGVPAGSELDSLAEYLAGCKRVRFCGLMTLPPFFDDAEQTRPYFRRLREAGESLSMRGLFRGERLELSMGMTHDLETAIEEGATIIRVGTAIFGEREYGPPA